MALILLTLTVEFCWSCINVSPFHVTLVFRIAWSDPWGGSCGLDIDFFFLNYLFTFLLLQRHLVVFGCIYKNNIFLFFVWVYCKVCFIVYDISLIFRTSFIMVLHNLKIKLRTFTYYPVCTGYRFSWLIMGFFSCIFPIRAIERRDLGIL